MHRYPLLIIGCLFGLVFGVCSIGNAADRPGRKYALVVGVHEYRAGQPLPDLKYAEPDADQLAEVLTGGGYQVTLMTQTTGGKKGNFDKLPTASNIRDHLQGILGNPFLKEQDTVLLALAGHGVLLRVKETDESGKEQIVERFFFCPMDADVKTLVTEAKAGRFIVLDDVRRRYHLVSMDELYAQLGSGCKAGLKVLFTDACRNDPSRDLGARATESLTLPPLPPPPGGVAALFSCSAHQKAQEDATLGHGVFFHYVIEGLGGKADFSKDGTVTLSELNEYVGTNTYDFVYKKYKSRQIPELKGTIRGRAELLPLGLPKLVTNSIGMKLVQIPAGEFLMGSPEGEKDRDDDEQQHRVRITQAFYLGQHEVTVGQFRQFVNATGYKTEAEKDGEGGYGWNESTGEFEGDPKYNWKNTGFEQKDDHPVVNVTWNDAVAFCKWLSGQEGETYRLPTEAEWEYACRGGAETSTAYYHGNDPEGLAQVANIADASFNSKKKPNGLYWGISSDDGYVFTSPTGQYHPNAFGLYDMHGNVWEWCADWYESEYYDKSPVDDPTGPKKGSFRVNRGGSWSSTARYCRSANRSRSNPTNRINFLGFRVARVLSSK